jgi:FkbM family methyltransferase
MPQRRGLAEGDRQVVADLVSLGFVPGVVYDVGGAVGGWTAEMMKVLPGAEFHVFEPLAEVRGDYREGLAEVKRLGGGRVHVHATALSDVTGAVEIAMTEDGVGTSVHRTASVQSTAVKVACHRLDEYAAEKKLPGADLVKMDVQAHEDAILRGMGALLDSAQVLILETWLRRCYGPKTPLLTELVMELREKGFTFVRVIDEYYNDRHELLAMDAVFMRRSLLERLAVSPGGMIEGQAVGVGR